MGNPRKGELLWEEGSHCGCRRPERGIAPPQLLHGGGESQMCLGLGR